jgi:soluble lytic murein transglycosylase
MPIVPTADNFRVLPSAGGFTPAQEGFDAQRATGDQLQRTGAALSGVGEAARGIALDMQDQVNQTRVNDAINQARVAQQNLTFDPTDGFKAQQGLNALQRANGQALPDEYGGKLRDAFSEISGNLSNDQQKRMFQQTAGGMMAQFHGDVESHMLGEFKNYRMSVNDATINLASDDAKRNWQDPQKISAALDAAKAATVEKLNSLGLQGAPIDAALLTTTSKVHTDVVMAALENGNPNYALGYLDRNKGQMTADDILRVQGHVNQQVWMGQAQGAVQAATTAMMPKVAPTDFDRMTQITAQTESGGRETNPDGSTVTSPKGAQGVMQVMPGTNRDPGYGVRPAADDSPAERARVGRDYLAAMMQRYGDPAKAWAAYNAGPGRLDQALKDASSSRAGTRTSWLEYMPKETQAYVQTNVAALQKGQGQPDRPTESDFVQTALSQLPAGSPPMLVAKTREQAVQQFTMLNKSLAEQGDNALANAQRWIAGNPGGMDALPPALKDAVTRYAPGKVDDLVKYARTLDRGENVTDLVLYNRMASHPEETAAMTDAQFEMLRAKLSQADFKHFANERSADRNGTTDTSAGGINSKALNQSLNERLEALQVNTAPPPKDAAGRERLGAIQQFVRTSVFQAQQQAGKKFTPAELDDHVNSLFAKDATFKSTFLGVPYNTTTTPVMALQVGDIPSATVDQLKAAFAQRGKVNPTNTDLINAYRTMKLGSR